ncbi:MAG: MFS transporter [Chloroflexi bacterium]|nr:MFS transporter [Chloroflexota bacterium]
MIDVSQRRYQVIGTAWLAWFVNYIDRTKTAALLPLITASLAMDTGQTGSVLFAFFIGYAAIQPLAGFLTDLVGAKKTLALSVAAFSIFTWTMALVGNWQELFIRNLLFGLSQGFEVTAGSRLAATWFPPATRGRAFGFHQTAYTIAPIFAPFIAVPIAQATGSWRWSFMVVAFFGLPVLAAIDHFVSDRPERDPRTSQAELEYIFGEDAHKRGSVLDPARATTEAELPPGERPTPYREIFLNRSVALMFVAGFFGLLATWGLTTWLPTYGVQQLKLPLIIAGSLSSIVFAGSLVGVLAGGYLSDKVFGTKRTPIWLFGGVVMAAAILWATTFQPGAPLIEMYAAFFIAGLAASMSPTGQLFAPYLAELLTPGAVGRSLGVVVLGGMIGSAVAQPLVAALVIQTPAGPQFWPAFVMFAACGVVTTVCVAFMIEPRVHRTYLGYLLAGRKEGKWQPSPASA